MSDPLPLSIVEHYAYCPRQAALIHVEAQWLANADTAQGEADHAAVDRAVRQISREGVVSWLSLPVWSARLDVQGICDVVEFRDGVPVPIEHKPKLRNRLASPAAQQLAVQAMCLEEMTGLAVAQGFLFTRNDGRRHCIVIDDDLRAAVVSTVAACHELVDQQLMPPVLADGRCKVCSLAERCRDVDLAPSGAGLFEPAPLGEW